MMKELKVYVVDEKTKVKIGNLEWLVNKQAEQINTLLSKVDELENKLTKTTKVNKHEITNIVPKQSNLLREQIIEEAKQFIENSKNKVGYTSGRKGYFYESTDRTLCDAEFIVNSKERTVVTLLKTQYGKSLQAKGIAKCLPTDVFNEHLGKAIALGRALGLDVSKFENAVLPHQPVAGHIVELNKDISNPVYEYKKGEIYTVVNSSPSERYQAMVYSPIVKNSKIIDDTNAKY